jgi:hypothetical protein
MARQQGIDLQRLQRRVAFERLLTRLFAGKDPPWLLKGGYALELRLRDRARSTLDLDLSVPDPVRLLPPALRDGVDRLDMQIHERLQIEAGRDLGDGFQFLIRLPRRASMPGGPGLCPLSPGRGFQRRCPRPGGMGGGRHPARLCRHPPCAGSPLAGSTTVRRKDPRLHLSLAGSRQHPRQRPARSNPNAPDAPCGRPSRRGQPICSLPGCRRHRRSGLSHTPPWPRSWACQP